MGLGLENNTGLKKKDQAIQAIRGDLVVENYGIKRVLAQESVGSNVEVIPTVNNGRYPNCKISGINGSGGRGEFPASQRVRSHNWSKNAGCQEVMKNWKKSFFGFFCLCIHVRKPRKRCDFEAIIQRAISLP